MSAVVSAHEGAAWTADTHASGAAGGTAGPSSSP